MKISRARRTVPALISLTLAGLLTALGQAPQTGPAGTPPSPAGSPAKPSLAGGSTATPARSAASPEKVVLKVGAEQLTQAQLDFLFSSLNPQVQQSVATQGRRPIGEQYALMVVLSQQALKDHLDVSPTFRRQAELQHYQMLAQAEYRHLTSQTTVGPEEVNQYYSTHQAEFEEAQVRQVVVRKRPEGAKEGTPGLAPQEARARLESIRKALAAGTDAKQVAQDFKAPNDVAIDAEVRTIRHGELPAALDKAAFQLKDGELSEPLDTPQAVVLLQVGGHHHVELKQASAPIENKLRQQKLEAVVEDLKKKAVIWMDEDYFQPPQAPPRLTTVPDRPRQP